MTCPREKGYSILHRFCLTSIVFAWFWFCLFFWAKLQMPLINLPWNYSIWAVFGLLISSIGSMHNYGDFFQKNFWQRVRDSFSKSNFQTGFIAFFVFGAYFATKDNETSRLFLLFYFLSSWPLLLLVNLTFPSFIKRIFGLTIRNRNTIIIGSASALDELEDWIETQKIHGFDYIGCFSTTNHLSLIHI